MFTTASVMNWARHGILKSPLAALNPADGLGHVLHFGLSVFDCNRQHSTTAKHLDNSECLHFQRKYFVCMAVFYLKKKPGLLFVCKMHAASVYFIDSDD